MGGPQAEPAGGGMITEEQRALMYCAERIQGYLRAAQPDSNLGCWRCDARLVAGGHDVVRIVHFIGRDVLDVPTEGGPMRRSVGARWWDLSVGACVIYTGWLAAGNVGTPQDCADILAGGTWGPMSPDVQYQARWLAYRDSV